MEYLTTGDAVWREQIKRYVDDEGPVLIEVRFPRCGTSPDWYLVRSLAEVEQILSEVAAGMELIMTSVWHMVPSPKCMRVRKEAAEP